jgi:hypothetical protein
MLLMSSMSFSCVGRVLIETGKVSCRRRRRRRKREKGSDSYITKRGKRADDDALNCGCLAVEVLLLVDERVVRVDVLPRLVHVDPDQAEQLNEPRLVLEQLRPRRDLVDQSLLRRDFLHRHTAEGDKQGRE